MHVGIIIETIGGYHAARLEAAAHLLQEQGSRLTAIEITNAEGEHPWGDVDGLYRFNRVTVLPLQLRNRQLGRKDRASIRAALPRVLTSLHLDALAIPGWGFDYSRIALDWCRRKQVRKILMSDSKEDDQPRRWWKEKYKSWRYARHFDSAIVAGTAHRRYAAKLGIPECCIYAPYDVVDNQYWGEKSALARSSPDLTRSVNPAIPRRPYFIAVTRLVPRKNVQRLIRAFSLYRSTAEKDVALDLVICGSGTERRALEEEIQRLQLTGTVHLPGFMDYHAMPAWYGLSTAFVHAPLQEQWGLVVNEAMACRLPVLVSRQCGAYADLVRDRENGLGFDATNEREMADAMLFVHHHRADAERLGHRALEAIQHYSPHAFAKALANASDGSHGTSPGNAREWRASLGE